MKTETNRNFCCYDQLRWFDKHYELALKTKSGNCAYCLSPTPMKVTEKVIEENIN